jgi:ankyrin repeat protein/ribosomal protein L7Ae-like RNA K-turn-binding protein
MPISSFRINVQKTKCEGLVVQPEQQAKNQYITDLVEFTKSSLLGKVSEQNFIVPFPYVDQFLTKDSDSKVRTLLSELHRFELRSRDAKKYKRRLIVGLREVFRHLAAGRVKLLIIAVDVDEYLCSSEEWRRMIRSVREEHLPVAYGLTKKELASLLGHRGATSVVGIINPDGAYQLYGQLLELSSNNGSLWHQAAISVALAEVKDGKGDILHILAYCGHIGVLKVLRESYPQLNEMLDYVSSRNGQTLLMYGCSGGQYAMVKLLVSWGARLDIKDFWSRTALHYAALSGCLDFFQMLLDAWPCDTLQDSIMAKDCEGFDVFALAIITKSDDIVECIITRGTVLTIDHYLLSVGCTNAKFFKKLLKTIPKDWDNVHFVLLTREIAKVGALENLRALIDHLKNLKFSDEDIRHVVDQVLEDGKTAIWWAVHHGHVGVMRELVALGANEELSACIGQEASTSVDGLLEKWKNIAGDQ